MMQSAAIPLSLLLILMATGAAAQGKLSFGDTLAVCYLNPILVKLTADSTAVSATLILGENTGGIDASSRNFPPPTAIRKLSLSVNANQHKLATFESADLVRERSYFIAACVKQTCFSALPITFASDNDCYRDHPLTLVRIPISYRVKYLMLDMIVWRLQINNLDVSLEVSSLSKSHDNDTSNLQLRLRNRAPLELEVHIKSMDPREGGLESGLCRVYATIPVDATVGQIEATRVGDGNMEIRSKFLPHGVDALEINYNNSDCKDGLLNWATYIASGTINSQIRSHVESAVDMLMRSYATKINKNPCLQASIFGKPEVAYNLAWFGLRAQFSIQSPKLMVELRSALLKQLLGADNLNKLRAKLTIGGVRDGADYKPKVDTSVSIDTSVIDYVLRSTASSELSAQLTTLISRVSNVIDGIMDTVNDPTFLWTAMKFGGENPYWTFTNNVPAAFHTITVARPDVLKVQCVEKTEAAQTTALLVASRSTVEEQVAVDRIKQEVTTLTRSGSGSHFLETKSEAHLLNALRNKVSQQVTVPNSVLPYGWRLRHLENTTFNVAGTPYRIKRAMISHFSLVVRCSTSLARDGMTVELATGESILNDAYGLRIAVWFGTGNSDTLDDTWVVSVTLPHSTVLASVDLTVPPNEASVLRAKEVGLHVNPLGVAKKMAVDVDFQVQRHFKPLLSIVGTTAKKATGALVEGLLTAVQGVVASKGAEELGRLAGYIVKHPCVQQDLAASFQLAAPVDFFIKYSNERVTMKTEIGRHLKDAMPDTMPVPLRRGGAELSVVYAESAPYGGRATPHRLGAIQLTLSSSDDQASLVNAFNKFVTRLGTFVTGLLSSQPVTGITHVSQSLSEMLSRGSESAKQFWSPNPGPFAEWKKTTIAHSPPYLARKCQYDLLHSSVQVLKMTNATTEDSVEVQEVPDSTDRAIRIDAAERRLQIAKNRMDKWNLMETLMKKVNDGEQLEDKIEEQTQRVDESRDILQLKQRNREAYKQEHKRALQTSRGLDFFFNKIKGVGVSAKLWAKARTIKKLQGVLAEEEKKLDTLKEQNRRFRNELRQFVDRNRLENFSQRSDD